MLFLDSQNQKNISKEIKKQGDVQPMQSNGCQVIERLFPLPALAVVRLMEEGGETTGKGGYKT